MADVPLPTPYDAPELYDALFEGLDFDLAFWLRVGREAEGPILDLGCGTGRILLRLREAGLDADGLDSSLPMLHRLEAKARERGLTVGTFEGDMCRFTLQRRYARVISAFNAFAHCATTEDQIACLTMAREHLAPGGALVLHTSYPGPAYWSETDGVPMLEIEVEQPMTGRRLQLWDTRFRDPVAQLQRSEIEVREVDAEGGVTASHRFTTSQRWVYRWELELLLRVAGFRRWELQGGFDGKPLKSVDDPIVAWAWVD